MRNIEDDIYALWGFLWRHGMVGSIEKTETSGKKKVRYFLNDYGKQIVRLTVERYKLSESDEIERLLEERTAKVLIVCPFCGGKTEQGLTRCQRCGADL